MRDDVYPAALYVCQRIYAVIRVKRLWMEWNMQNMDHGFDEERYTLAFDRLAQLSAGAGGDAEEPGIFPPGLARYFTACARWMTELSRLCDRAESGQLYQDTAEQLAAQNETLYRELDTEAYAASYANPTFCEGEFGRRAGIYLCILYTELRGAISSAYELRREELTVTAELLLEVYGVCVDRLRETGSASGTVVYDELSESLRNVIYWYAVDYMELFAGRRMREQIGLSPCHFVQIIKEADISDPRYLYYFGEYVSGPVRKLAAYIGGLPQQTIEEMARVFTKGYADGFVHAGIDLSEKNLVEIRGHLGFERVMREAIRQFEQMGLRPVISRAGDRLVTRAGQRTNGYIAGSVNRQYEYDHRNDILHVLDKRYIQRRLDLMTGIYGAHRRESAGYAGPALWETFGEQPFSPARDSYKPSEEQEALRRSMDAKTAELLNRYIDPTKRSFTIIAYPTPEIGEDFEEIFQHTIRLNALDSQEYGRVQQRLIDALDRGSFVHIRGGKGNETDLRVCLYRLTDPDRETIFENCVADVNIPVGEVFTTPVLEGTNGVLHVSRVYLDGLLYKDLRLVFENGIVTDYGCANFPDMEKNRAFIRENLLGSHEFLPMGEFAIGTNTTAYVMARQYGIEEKLPILIAEKTGPHFAVGDTCYSYSEDVKVYNPDGKEIIARENVYSRKRGEPGETAYFHCHTDITLPYDELDEISVETPGGERIALIRGGRFVLPGCERLNAPLDSQNKQKDIVCLEAEYSDIRI